MDEVVILLAALFQLYIVVVGFVVGFAMMIGGPSSAKKYAYRLTVEPFLHLARAVLRAIRAFFRWLFQPFRWR